MNAYQPDPSHDGPPLEFYRGRLTWPSDRWDAQQRMSEFMAGARITRILQRIEPREQIAQTAYQVATDPNRPYERAEEVELCAVCNLWWSTHAENDWCDPTPAFLPSHPAHPDRAGSENCVECGQAIRYARPGPTVWEHVTRCDYPGCLGPADGSECRHPRPEDELID